MRVWVRATPVKPKVLCLGKMGTSSASNGRPEILLFCKKRKGNIGVEKKLTRLIPQVWSSFRGGFLDSAHQWSSQFHRGTCLIRKWHLFWH